VFGFSGCILRNAHNRDGKIGVLYNIDKDLSIYVLYFGLTFPNTVVKYRYLLIGIYLLI